MTTISGDRPPQRFVLICECGFRGQELGFEDAKFLRIDKVNFGVKTPCPECGCDMRLVEVKKP